MVAGAEAHRRLDHDGDRIESLAGGLARQIGGAIAVPRAA
jgi:hypothetical protein